MVPERLRLAPISVSGGVGYSCGKPLRLLRNVFLVEGAWRMLAQFFTVYNDAIKFRVEALPCPILALQLSLQYCKCILDIGGSGAVGGLALGGGFSQVKAEFLRHLCVKDLALAHISSRRQVHRLAAT